MHLKVSFSDIVNPFYKLEKNRFKTRNWFGKDFLLHLTSDSDNWAIDIELF